MYSIKYPDLSQLDTDRLYTIKDKIKIDVERGNVLINKAILHHNFLERESKEHSQLSKRYNRLHKIAVTSEIVLTALEVGLSGVAVVATPVIPIFGVFALGAASIKQ